MHTHTKHTTMHTHTQSIQTCTHVSADTLHIAARCTQTYTHTTHACIGIHKANTKQNTETHARNHTGTHRTQTRKREHTACMHTDRHTHARSLEISTHIILWDILLPFCRNGDGNLRFFLFIFTLTAAAAVPILCCCCCCLREGLLLLLRLLLIYTKFDWKEDVCVTGLLRWTTVFSFTSGGGGSIRKTRNFWWILRGFAVFFHTFYHFTL